MTTTLATIPSYPYGLTLFEWWMLSEAINERDFAEITRLTQIGITRQLTIPARLITPPDRKRILIATYVFPRDSRDGGSSFIYKLADWLVDQDYDVHYLCFDNKPQAPDARFTCHFCGNNIPIYDAPATIEMITDFDNLVNELNPFAIIVAPIMMANLCMHQERIRHRIVWVTDIRTRIIPCFQESGNRVSHFPWTVPLESMMLSFTTAQMCFDPNDAREIMKMLPGARPLMVNLPSEITETRLEDEVLGRLLFVGSFSWDNAIAMEWFFNNCWDLIVQSCPLASLDIVGNVSGKLQHRRNYNVELYPDVRDLEPFYRRAQICIIPHFLRGGVKGKLIGALSYGKPVVARVCGLDGFTEDNQHCQFAMTSDDGPEFALSVIALLQGHCWRNSLASNAREVAERRLPVETAFLELQHELERK